MRAHTLSDVGEHYLAGLLAHGRGDGGVLHADVNGFGRFRPNALAPQAVLWGRDNRGAMLRVLGGCGDAATRIENRIGEPAANPYLYIASQIHAGLDGIERRLRRAAGDRRAVCAAPASAAADQPRRSARRARAPTQRWCAAFGAARRRLVHPRQALRARSATTQAEDKDAWQAREYFSRF